MGAPDVERTTQVQQAALMRGLLLLARDVRENVLRFWFLRKIE